MSNAYDFGNVLPIRPPEQAPLPEAVDIEIVTGDPKATSFDARTGTVRVESADGSITIETASDADQDDKDHFANLAGKIDPFKLSAIAEELLRGIEIDDQTRNNWLNNRAQGIGLLGLELTNPSTSQAGGAQLEGTSKVTHPLLKEAVLRFQANARGELLPTDGPVKVRDDSNSERGSDLAQALEEDLNHYLTTTASEYYPDTDRALLFTGFGGCSFKKVYNCPIRRRPVSESIDAKDLIVSNAATDLKSSGRVTHRVMMRPATLRRMQLVGAYRDIPLVPGLQSLPNIVDQKIAQVQGVDPQPNLDPRDRDREILECYCDYEIPGYEHEEKGELTGLPLPWKITIDKDSRQVLEVRRNWEPGDDLCLPMTVFVKYPFVPGFGFYDIGLLQILGDTTLAATAGWREMLDAGAFSCFPGFLYLKALGKQLTNEFRIPPGGGVPIDAGGATDIRQAIMPLPYQPPNAAMMQLVQNVVETGQRVGGTAELPVGEGKQDAPVGTTLAMIEQATKVMDAVHKRLHQAQSQEFQLLKDRFMEDPEALWRHNKKSRVLAYLVQRVSDSDPEFAAQKNAKDIANEKRKKMFITALADYALVPMADPNTSSQMSRIMKSVALKQLQAANPALYNAKEVDERILKSIGWSDPEALFAPPAPPQEPPPDPRMVTAQANLIKAQTAALALQEKSRNADEDRQLARYKEDVAKYIAELKVVQEQIIHAHDGAKLAAQTQSSDLNKHLDRQAGLEKHSQSIAADLHKHQGGLVADLHKHHTGLNAQQAGQRVI